jgi:hypothetical protein
MFVFTRQHSAFGTRAPGARVYTDRFYEREVNDGAVLAHGATRHVMTTTTDRDRQATFMRSLTAAWIPATPATLAVASGRLSIIPFQTWRDSSYPSLPRSSILARRRVPVLWEY